VQASAAVVDAMSRGVISAEEAQAAAVVLEHHRKAVETFDLERRLAALEQKRKLAGSKTPERRLITQTYGPGGQSLSAGVARENGWSKDHTRRVIEEHKRTSRSSRRRRPPVTPYDPADQICHLHLTY
jgi:hypothetical protein